MKDAQQAVRDRIQASIVEATKGYIGQSTITDLTLGRLRETIKEALDGIRPQHGVDFIPEVQAVVPDAVQRDRISVRFSWPTAPTLNGPMPWDEALAHPGWVQNENGSFSNRELFGSGLMVWLTLEEPK